MDSIKNDEQKKRLIIIQNLLQEIQINKNKNSVGKFKEVLVENKLKNQTKYFGRTQELTPVIFDANKEDVGKVIDVEIKKYNRNTLFGSKITSKNEAAA